MGQAFVLSRAPSVASPAPVLRVLMEAVLAGVQRDDIVSARAAARALVAFLDGIPVASAGNNVIKLGERRAVYGSRPGPRRLLAPQIGPERFYVVVIGGGQAGLSVGYYLARQGAPFVILDAHERVDDDWRCRFTTKNCAWPRSSSLLDAGDAARVTRHAVPASCAFVAGA